MLIVKLKQKMKRLLMDFDYLTDLGWKMTMHLLKHFYLNLATEKPKAIYFVTHLDYLKVTLMS